MLQFTAKRTLSQADISTLRPLTATMAVELDYEDFADTGPKQADETFEA